MSLLSPWSLAWLGLLAPLVVLYILKRRRETRIVGSTWLWELAQRDMRAERPFKRLIPHLSLLLQALVLILGALALARPAGAGQVPSGARVAVIVDTSTSMAAREPEGTRLAMAQSAARAIARTLPPGGEMMLVEASREPVVLAPPTSDLATLERAIDRLALRGAGSAIEPAVALAAERLRGAASGSRIVVLTDAAVDGEITLGSSVPVEPQRIGTELPNVALVALDVRPRPTEEAPDRAEIYARVQRFGGAAGDVWITASIDGGGVVASRRVALGTDGAESAVLSADLPPDADGRAPFVRVELSGADPAGGASAPLDALSLDDVAVAASPGARRLPVFLVGEAPASIRRVLLADRDVELFETSLAELDARRTRDPDAPDLDGLLVFTGATPDVTPPGDTLVVTPTGDTVLGLSLGAAVRAPRIVTWEEGDPRLRFVRFADVHLAEVRPITDASARVLLRTDAGSAIGSVERPDGEATIVAFDPDHTDWPDRPSFVVFVRNLLERVRARRAAGGIAPGGLGDPLRVPAPDGATVIARAPDGSARDALSRGGVAVIDVPAIPGVFRAEIEHRHLAAIRNLLDAHESDLRPRARFVSTEGGTEVDVQESVAPREAWPWLAGGLLLVLVLEALWATRKAAA